VRYYNLNWFLLGVIVKQALSPSQRLKSIGYAVEGIVALIKTQPNAQLHCLAIVIVVTVGWLTKITSSEWLALVVVIGMVLSFEALNSALEVLCDKVETDDDPQIKMVKDIAAGGVLLASITAAVVGGLVFFPYWF
jgi:diacylglycerol kinase (ATP)